MLAGLQGIGGWRQAWLMRDPATAADRAAFREAYVRLLGTLASGDRARILQEAIGFGLLDPRESAEAQGLFTDFLLAATEPFSPRLQPFAFRDAEYSARSREVITRFTRSLRYSPPPRRLLFLHRKLGGLFQLLKRLDVTMDLTPYWERMVGAAPPAPR